MEIAGKYALPLKPLLRNASDHRRTISTYYTSFASFYPCSNLSTPVLATPLPAQSHRYIRANALKIIFVRVNSNFIIRAGHYRRASFQILTLIISPFHFGMNV